ncbi:serine hydrolase domain-containing protein [Nonomuraea sp. NPDC055795]
MADLTHLQSLLDSEATSLHVPGAAVGVLFDGAEHVLTTGVTSVDAPAPVTADTLFQIGSTTKTVTATVIMHLIEEGRLDLDGRVRKYLPEFRLADESAAREVTIRHLLTHTGGFLGDIDDGESWGDDALAEAIKVYERLPQLFAPGTLASYSNAGFRLLGRVIEVVCGEPYESVVERVVLQPLGMRDSFFFPWVADRRRRRPLLLCLDIPDGRIAGRDAPGGGHGPHVPQAEGCRWVRKSAIGSLWPKMA